MKAAMFVKETRIDGKVVIITGANTGIGKETAIDLARRGGKVYLACRDKKRGEDALNEIKRKSKSDEIYLLQLDLASMESIRGFSKKFHELESHLHILINNAGIMWCAKDHTKDGFELQFGTNHLGHFLLTHLLLDLIKISTPSRIIIVSSLAHISSDIKRDDLMGAKSYSRFQSYAQSKLANILFSRELSNQLINTGVTVNSCHPGLVLTDLARYLNPNVKKYLWDVFMRPFAKTPLQGAQTQIRLAVDSDLEKVTGKYFSECKEASTSKQAKNDETASWLYKKSMELVNCDKFLE